MTIDAENLEMQSTVSLRLILVSIRNTPYEEIKRVPKPFC